MSSKKLNGTCPCAKRLMMSSFQIFQVRQTHLLTYLSYSTDGWPLLNSFLFEKAQALWKRASDAEPGPRWKKTQVAASNCGEKAFGMNLPCFTRPWRLRRCDWWVGSGVWRGVDMSLGRWHQRQGSLPGPHGRGLQDVEKRALTLKPYWSIRKNRLNTIQ